MVFFLFFGGVGFFFFVCVCLWGLGFDLIFFFFKLYFFMTNPSETAVLLLHRWQVIAILF